jgi:hypothetical protein
MNVKYSTAPEETGAWIARSQQASEGAPMRAIEDDGWSKTSRQLGKLRQAGLRETKCAAAEANQKIKKSVFSSHRRHNVNN